MLSRRFSGGEANGAANTGAVRHNDVSYCIGACMGQVQQTWYRIKSLEVVEDPPITPRYAWSNSPGMWGLELSEWRRAEDRRCVGNSPLTCTRRGIIGVTRVGYSQAMCLTVVGCGRNAVDTREAQYSNIVASPTVRNDCGHPIDHRECVRIAPSAVARVRAPSWHMGGCSMLRSDGEVWASNSRRV